ncbi:amino acid permease [Komagataeibacter europaeus]|uniref:amino acid permease n=1 Tax=Komagataeibacter europaeus TaxID=33995 RepID=UPI000B3E71F8|nr:amino acid permease [Komagataeibacter europaeus]ARW15402.1 putative amino acid permease YfnA [Komagataeibacter europaeus]
MKFDRVKSLDAILATAKKKSLNRSLGAFQLTMLGIGGIIGTGIFVLTSEAAQKAGPGMMLSFILAGFICMCAAICYSELASMVPTAGSAYTYTYAVMGERLAWMVGWALILEYAIGASAVASSWSGYMIGLIENLFHIKISPLWVNSPSAGGYINLPAVVITLLITWLLILGTTESARANAILVGIKVAALSLFAILAIPVMNTSHFEPFMPTGITGMAGAAASIFFAYVGFDAVSTAAEETRNPQRNVPIALIASLAFCTIFYLLVSLGAIGSPLGAQPITGADGSILAPGTLALEQRCRAIAATGAQDPLPCSHEALAHVLRSIGWTRIGNLIGLAATIALPSVVLMMIFGQTRIFFTMARDGLLPDSFARVHPRYRTPHIVTIVTGIGTALGAAFLPVGTLADYSNSGTLFAFAMVAVSVLILRRTDPTRVRPFRAPAIWLFAPLAIIGCIYLYLSLDLIAILVLPVWGVIGLLIYYGYGRSRSYVGRGIEVSDSMNS